MPACPICVFESCPKAEGGGSQATVPTSMYQSPFPISTCPVVVGMNYDPLRVYVPVALGAHV